MLWIALFSQSGSEIVEVSKRLGRYPDFIYTNNKDKKSWHKDLQKHSAVVVENYKKIPNEIERVISMFKLLRGNPVVTLHGYLRIMPMLSCKMYNGHPGDIVKYPELKGKDPQRKALSLGLKSTGSVLHEVTEEVDSGEIISYNTYDIKKDETLDSLINNLRNVSIDQWSRFLQEKLIEESV